MLPPVRLLRKHRAYFACLPRKSSPGNVSDHLLGNNLAAYSTQRLLPTEGQEEHDRLRTGAEHRICENSWVGAERLYALPHPQIHS